MSRANEERYVFESEWYDVQAALIRKYLFTFYPADNTIEMVRNLKIIWYFNLCPPDTVINFWKRIYFDRYLN